MSSGSQAGSEAWWLPAGTRRVEQTGVTATHSAAGFLASLPHNLALLPSSLTAHTQKAGQAGYGASLETAPTPVGSPGTQGAGRTAS